MQQSIVLKCDFLALHLSFHFLLFNLTRLMSFESAYLLLMCLGMPEFVAKIIYSLKYSFINLLS